MKNIALLVCLLTLVALSCKKTDKQPTPIGTNDTTNTKPIGVVYVANENSESVSVFDVIKPHKMMDIDLSDPSISMVMPHNVQVAPNGKTVWVTAMGMYKTEMDQVVVINPNTNAIIKRIYLGYNLHLAHVVLDELCEYAFVTAYNSNQVFQIDAKFFTLTKTINLDSNCGPHGLRYSNGQLYIAGMLSKQMIIVDTKTSQIKTISLSGLPIQTAVSPNGKFVYVSLFDKKSIAKFSIDNASLKNIDLPIGANGPIQLYATPDSKMLYVCDQGAMYGQSLSNKLFVIDIDKDSVCNTILVGRGPHGVVISNDGKYAYITNSEDNTMYCIDSQTKTTKYSLPTGIKPNGISYWYGNGGMP